MTEQDKAAQPAKEYNFRAWHPQTRDVIMLQTPRLIKYHAGYQLQERDSNGNWTTAAPESDTYEENISE